VDDRLAAYTEREMPWRLIEATLASPAMLAVIPMQDLLALGSAARMNTPGKIGANWRWRFDWEQLPAGLADRLSQLIRKYARLTPAESS
jgi:4-alpha-glucanotransferase